MRKQLLSVFLPLLVLGLMASAAETPASQPASQRNELQRVNVVRGADEIRVEISARGVVTPKVSTADSPARLVVELPGTVMATGQNHSTVGRAGVKGVRIGMNGQTPPTTRVVVDLEHACRYDLNPSADGKLVLTLYTQKTVVASAPKNVKAILPAQNAAKAALPPGVQTAQAASTSSRDFVFVEPAYEAKKTVPDAAAEPTERAQEAAAKFADKTAAELLPAGVNAAQSSQSASSVPAIQPAVNLAAEQQAQAGQHPALAGPKYTGEPISVNLKDVDLKDFFRLIHEISGLNVVLDPAVKGSLTIVLDEVPWDQALDIVLRIATRDTLKKEAETERDLEKAQAEAVAPVTVTRVLSYGKADKMKDVLKKFLSQRGDILADDRSNQLIIRDIPSVIPVIDNLIRQLDRKSQQVEIEARVVSATRSFAQDIGVQLGFAGTATSGRNFAAGTSQVGTSTFGGTTPPSPVTVANTTPPAMPLSVDLGASAPTSGLLLAHRSPNFAVDFFITAAEAKGVGKLLSKPRVVTQNNEKATVKH